MQYMSLEPMSLALGSNFPFNATSGGTGESESLSKETLVEKLCLHSLFQHTATRKELDLPLVLTQINCSWELSDLFSRNLHLIGMRPKRTLSVSERVVESATTLWDYFLLGLGHVFSQWIYPIITQIFVLGILCHRCIAEAIILVLNWRLRPDTAALKDISATAQQVDIRLQQFCYWPTQYAFLRQRRDDWKSMTDRHPDYIRFYNSLWLVANDVIIGIALGSYIIDNADWVASQINSMLTDWTLVGLEKRIVWLTDWPGGLKLNTELARFLGDFVLWVLDYWSSKLLRSSNSFAVSDLFRFHRLLSTLSSSHHLFHRILEFRWRDHADCSLFRPAYTANCPFLFVLLCVSSHFSLAVDDTNLPFSSFPW